MIREALVFLVYTHLHLLDQMQTNIENTRICFKEQIPVYVWDLASVHNKDLKLVFVRAYNSVLQSHTTYS